MPNTKNENAMGTVSQTPTAYSLLSSCCWFRSPLLTLAHSWVQDAAGTPRSCTIRPLTGSGSALNWK